MATKQLPIENLIKQRLSSKRGLCLISELSVATDGNLIILVMLILNSLKLQLVIIPNMKLRTGVCLYFEFLTVQTKHNL